MSGCQCGLNFASDYAFDRHRVGKHAYTFDEGLLLEPPRTDGRRCLTLEEMQADGWRVNRYGRLVDPKSLRHPLRKGVYSLPDARAVTG